MNSYRTPQSLIAMIRRVGSARGRRRAGLFSIEGTRLAERALRAGAPLDAVLIAERLATGTEPRHRDLLAALNAAGCPVTIASDDVLADLTEGRDLGPIIGLVRMPHPASLSDVLAEWRDGRQTTDDGRQVVAQLTPSTPIPPTTASLPTDLLTTDRLNTDSQTTPPPFLLAALDIVDPGNVGALTRTAHATGAAALLTVGVSDPYHPRATRISRGSIFRLPVIEYETAEALLADLGQHEIIAVGTAASDGAPLPRVNWPRRATAILMGNEAEGLPPAIQQALDYSVTIPMPAGVDSYSVNAAAAIVLYTAAQAQIDAPGSNK